MLKNLFVGLLLSSLPLCAANATDIAQCGASEGYAYYPKFGLSAKDTDSGKWGKDRISNGQFSISVTDNGEFDLQFKDTSGGIYSTRAEGGKIVHLGKSEASLSLLVVYPNKTSETYTVYRTVDGNAEVMWTQNKFNTLIPKVAAFVASCSYLAF